MTEPNTTLPVREQQTLGEFWTGNRKIILPFVIAVALIIFGELLTTGFASAKHTLMLFKVASFLGFLGLAQTVVIISGNGGIDLSVGAMASLGAVLGAAALKGSDSRIAVAFVAVAVIGGLLGCLNGFMIAYFEIPALIMTLAMTSVVNGIIYILSSGTILTGTSSPMLQALSNGTTLGVPNIIYLWIATTAIAMFVLHFTKTGVTLYGVGSNERAAMLKGVDVKRFRVFVYGFSGAISALTGMLLLGYIGTAFLDIGSRYMLPSVAAATIGGISISGGSGNYIGVIGGAFVLTVISAVLISLQMGEAGRQIVFGLVILVLLMIYGREKTESGESVFSFANVLRVFRLKE